MTEKLHITWDQFHQDVKLLAAKIKSTGIYNKIIAISRGGLVPAGILAYELDIRNTSTINIVSYNNEQKLDTVQIFGFDGKADEHTLIVDDLSDTGHSIHLLRQLIPQACYAVVYAKPQGLKTPNLYAKEMPDQWLVFPWDI